MAIHPIVSYLVGQFAFDRKTHGAGLCAQRERWRGRSSRDRVIVPLETTHQMSKILVADDDGLIRDLIAIALTDAGHEVRAVADGATALGDYKKHRPDLVIADLVMPGGEGISLIKAIRQEPGFCPILAISGAIHADIFLPESVRLGADHALGKPIRPDDLVKTVSELLRKSGC